VIYTIINEALQVEKGFICDVLPVGLIGTNKGLTEQYIEFVTNWLMNDLDYRESHWSKNRLDWMDMISLKDKTNFVEKRVA